ncbi:hypothetical protein Cgig2_016969 [Carnegiea gigantea]|uniref:Uncharacterized protein n=1 Tax=Carnegiea gigantea TaxID=171969 RepID=A0A9Q1KFU8_9CARY|nr:hypothetical protein Cgig2_016969 [Carnegiea gigantea]
MESWVTSLIKDIREKVGISGSASATTTQSSVSTREYAVPPRSDKSYDYYPSRLQPSELQLLIQYLLQMRLTRAADNLVFMVGRLLFMEDLASESASSAPCLEMDMSKMGHACIIVPLGERPWPPEAGYTFVCWFQHKNLKSRPAEHAGTPCLRLFSVCSTYDRNTICEECYLQEDGTLTLNRADVNSLSFSNLELQEGQWYHLAVVHSKTDEGLTSIVHIYLNGKLRHIGELASAPTLVENWLLTIGIPAEHARVSDLCWAIRSCYLFYEKLSADCILFMYSLGRGYKVQFQGLNNIHSIGETRSGDIVARPDSSSDSGILSSDNAANLGCSEADCTNANWDLEMLEKLWLQLCRKKLLFAFNSARIEALRGSETLAMLNLVDPVSVAASSTGVPLFGHLHGDIYICRRCVTGNIFHPITEIAVVLALVETAETSEIIYIALKLLASALHQNPMNVQEMKTCIGYHLLSQFIHRKMSLFDIQCLEVLFKIAVSEDSSKLNNRQSNLPPLTIMPEASFMDVNSAEFQEGIDADGYYDNHDDFYENRENFTKLENTNAIAGTSISGALCDADIVEHVLLDWALWATAPAPIQLSIVSFLEDLVSVYKYKDHNLTVLRERNIVHHLLVTLHRDDVELVVLEKMAILLCIILEDKFLDSELESVATFVISTFHPIEVQVPPKEIWREPRNKRVILRNILLEALIDLQMTIASEELLEQWLSTLSSRLITHFLDEAVHPTSIAWLITLLGCCLTYSPIFPLEFQRSKGYQALVQVLPHFHDALVIYYTLFCLMFGKPIYPKLPEVGIQDFEALMPTSGDYSELKFSGVLHSIIAMAKSSFDQPSVQPFLPPKAVNAVQTTDAASVEENKEILEEANLEASIENTHSAQLTNWEAAAANAASILRLMTNLAKMWPSFSYTCGRADFLESCVDLYFSIVRAYGAVNSIQESNVATVPMDSQTLASGNQLPHANLVFLKSAAENAGSKVNFDPLIGIDASEPATAGATAVLDLIAEVLSDTLIRQISAVSLIESILASVPLHFDSRSVLTFQALCLDKVMNYLERRLLQDDEGNAPKLDMNSLWSNLGSFCSLIVDCVYLGVFARPASAVRVLEFCLMMLHYAKKDGQMTEKSLAWSGLLSIWKGSRPFDAILKSTNRMILYCFLPSFLATIDEQHNGPIMGPAEAESGEVENGKPSYSSQEEIRIDICIILELLHAHKQVIFHPSNLDVDLYCSLCINLIGLFPDHQKDAREAAISIFKYLLVHCRASLETVLITKPTSDRNLDVLNGGFDTLLTENVPCFMYWFQSSQRDIKQVLQQNAQVKWSEYIEASRKFKGERLKLLEDHRRGKMASKLEEAERRNIRYKEQFGERRYTLGLIREAVWSELEVACEKKWKLGLHAESEWRMRLQQLEHEHKVEPVSAVAWEDYWPVC